MKDRPGNLNWHEIIMVNHLNYRFKSMRKPTILISPEFTSTSITFVWRGHSHFESWHAITWCFQSTCFFLSLLGRFSSFKCTWNDQLQQLLIIVAINWRKCCWHFVRAEPTLAHSPMAQAITCISVWMAVAVVVVIAAGVRCALNICRTGASNRCILCTSYIHTINNFQS